MDISEYKYQNNRSTIIMDKYEESLRNFYSTIENVWPDNDKWHIYTHNTIDQYVRENVMKIHTKKHNPKILNAGSGGNTYDIPYEMYHMDITENKICRFKHNVTGSIENMPYKNNFFDICICVGTVINYCDAKKSLSELTRVLKPGGTLILEFENGDNPEFRKYHYDAGKKFVVSEYFGKAHSYWSYSDAYIFSLLENNFKIQDVKYFHILSAFIYSLTYNGNISTPFSVFDNILNKNKKIRKNSANIILTALKNKE